MLQSGGGSKPSVGVGARRERDLCHRGGSRFVSVRTHRVLAVIFGGGKKTWTQIERQIGRNTKLTVHVIPFFFMSKALSLDVLPRNVFEWVPGRDKGMSTEDDIEYSGR